MKPGDEFTVHIDRLEHYQGRGVGRMDGMAVFIPLSVPQDHVKIRVKKVKKNYAEGELLQVLEPGPARIEAPCKHVDEGCGGCSWQQVDYQEQLNQKRQFLEYAFKEIIANSTVSIGEIIPSDQIFGYRQRIQLQFRIKQMGYFARGTNDHIRIGKCLLADDKINTELSKLDAKLSRNQQHQLDKIHLEVVESQVKTSFLTKNQSSSFGFSQVNNEQNRVLIGLVIDWIRKLQPQNMYDLYCGSGNFSFPVQKYFPEIKITGIEMNEVSIERAKVKLNTLIEEAAGVPVLRPHLKFYCQDVRIFLAGRSELPEASLILIDPPRTGCENKVIEEFLNLAPNFIIYISCNLASLKRDLTKLSTMYDVNILQGLDMFPQTQHLEIFSVLSKKANTE